MSFGQERHKRSAELNGKLITIYADSRTVVTRAVRDSDKEEWPELFKRKPRKKVADEHQSDTQSSAE